MCSWVSAMAGVLVSPLVNAGFSASAASSVVVSAAVVVSLTGGTSGTSLTTPEALVFLFVARLALRSKPLKPPDFFPSPSVTSVSEVAPVFRSFLFPPRLAKNEERRVPVGVVFVAGDVVSAAVVVGSVVSKVGAAADVGSVTGLSSCGAVDDSAEGSSFGATGAVSVAVGLVASFLPNRPPKREFLFVGFGTLSRVPIGAVSVATGSATAAVSAAPSVDATAGASGSPITRAARRR